MSYDSPPPGRQPQTKRFFGALFDFSFNNFVTPAIIRVLYILGLVGIVIVYLTRVITSFLQNTIQGILVLLFGLIISFIYLALWRVVLEFFLAVVRMSEDIHHRGAPGGR
ncbi:MAG: DUF4282 domain-containing protein [Pseudonocardiales bacterium]|nr:DUF4282 domain-containing protein [Pseudonocardiales bacterium]